MTHITYRLTAKNRDQLWSPMLGSRVWATFTFFNTAENSSIFFLIQMHYRVVAISKDMLALTLCTSKIRQLLTVGAGQQRLTCTMAVLFV